MLGVDFALAFVGGGGNVITAEALEEWHRLGIEVVAVRWSAWEKTEFILVCRLLIEAGFRLHVYGEPTTTTNARFFDLIRHCQEAELPVERYWIDVEPYLDYEPRENEVLQAVTACEGAGVPYGIYTGQWVWDRYKWLSKFNCPVWFVGYPIDLDDFQPPSLTLFEAYTQYAIPGMAGPHIAWQYASGVKVAGANVNPDLFRVPV